MSVVISVFKKEFVDNFRDKRALFFALLYGPILLPLMMIGPMAIGVQKASIDFDEVLVVHMLAPDRAPNFVQFLREKQIDLINAPSDYEDKIKDMDIDLVVELAPAYEQALRDGKSTSIRLYYNKRSDDSEKAHRRLRVAIDEYNRLLGSSRLSLRGLSITFVEPIYVIGEDLGEVDVFAKAVSMVVPFIIVLSLTMGGFYLAVDSTAGERERHSLEPLLSLNISRFALVVGKLLALITFVSCSAVLAILSCYLLFTFIPIDELTALIQIELAVFVQILLVCLPLIPFFATSMMLIATYARDTKEAQTHLGLSMMLPMAPFFIIQFANVQSSNTLFCIPVMSQFLMIEQLIAGKPLEPLTIAYSLGGTLISAAIFFTLILKLYRRESILGA